MSTRGNCPTKSLPAGEIERAVVDQIQCIGNDPELLHETLAEAQRQVQSRLERLAAERAGVERGLTRTHAEIRSLAATGSPASTVTDRIADLNDQARQAERRLAEIGAEAGELERELVGEEDASAAFADFENVWQALSPREQTRLIGLLVARVEFDAADSTIEITFHPTGIKALAQGEHEGGQPVEDAA